MTYNRAGVESSALKRKTMKGDTQSTLLTCLPRLYQPQSLGSLPEHLAQCVAQAVPADCVGFNEVNLKKRQAVVTVYPPTAIGTGLLKTFETRMSEHPLIAYQRRSGDLSARKISDFQSKARFHRLALFQEFFRPLGVEDQFALSLRAGSTILALALNRQRRSFNENDRRTLNLLRPHLIRVYHNAEWATALRQELDRLRGSLETMPLGLAILDGRGRVQFANAQARKLLQQYFDRPKSFQRLPDALRDWLWQTCQWQGRPLPNPTSEFRVAGTVATLVVRCGNLHDADGRVLTFQQYALTRPPERLQSLGLTNREAEVLFWVVQGKSNPEIGIILDTASRTVQKHLEHVFAKLHVESRTAAARMAMEVFASACE